MGVAQMDFYPILMYVRLLKSNSELAPLAVLIQNCDP